MTYAKDELRTFRLRGKRLTFELTGWSNSEISHHGKTAFQCFLTILESELVRDVNYKIVFYLVLFSAFKLCQFFMKTLNFW